MSCSKPLPKFNFDVLCYFNRDQLERFSIICRPLKNFIDRYFHTKPYRIFDRLQIRGGLYALFNNDVRWHPKRDDYSVQQFLAGQDCSIDDSNRAWNDYKYYSLAEMRPYLGPTVRIKEAVIYVAASAFSPDHIAEMESISFLWRDGWINIWSGGNDHSLVFGQDFQLILNSPTILHSGEECTIDDSNRAWNDYKYYSLAEMRPYLGPTVRIKEAVIYVAASAFSPDHIAEMESISFLWRDGWINIWSGGNDHSLVFGQDFQLILNSPIILHCHLLLIYNPPYSLKDYKVLYTVNIIDVTYGFEDVEFNYWQEFLEQPGRKPVIVLADFPHKKIHDLLDRLSRAFSSAVLPNAFKIVLRHYDAPLIEFQETNKTLGEKLELKKGSPVDYQGLSSKSGVYTLERSSI